MNGKRGRPRKTPEPGAPTKRCRVLCDINQGQYKLGEIIEFPADIADALLLAEAVEIAEGLPECQ